MYDRNNWSRNARKGSTIKNNWSRNTGQGKNIKKSEFSQMIFLYAFFIAMAIAVTLVVIS